ncbi:MAG: ATP-binding protein [Thermoplasmata archaeon]
MPISDLHDILKLISRVEPIEELLEKTAGTITSSFGVKSLVICVLDERTGMFVPKCVKGFPEDNATAIRKHTYSADRRRKELLRGHRIDRRTYFVRAEEDILMTNEDMDYVTDMSALSTPRESPDHWHPLDYMLFLMVDRLGNWIGWVEIDYTVDGRIPSKEAADRIQILADLIGIAIENSKTYDDAISAMRDSQAYLDLIVRDIGSVVNPLIYYLEKVEKSGTLDAENAESLVKALTMSRAAKGLVDNVSKLSEARSSMSSEMSRYDLRDVLVRCISALKKEFPSRDIVVSFDCPDGECAIGADGLIHDLFMSILSNAVKHNPNSTAEVDVAISNGTGVWTVTIEDHGTGVPDDRKSEIFSKPVGTLEGLTGMGVGLSVVSLLVDRYSGVIGVSDRVRGDRSEGTCVEIAFPKMDDQGHADGIGAHGSGPY